MSNKRIYYPIHQVGFAVDGTSTFIAAHGVQSVGVTTTFNLENVFELGQLEIYDVVENLPEVEVTLEKVLDGSPLLYHLATNGSTVPGLVGRANTKSIVGMSVFPDTQVSSSGAPIAELHMSGMFPNSLSYSFSVGNRFSESVTMVGNNKVWVDVQDGGTALFSGAFTGNNDTPYSLTYSGGGVQNRWNLLYAPISGSPTTLDANGQTNAWTTVLPTDIYGISASGTNAALGTGYTVPVQSIAISADLGRDTTLELGTKDYYARLISFPVTVRTEIEVLATKYDNISATVAGGNNGAAAGYNTKWQTIRVQLQDGTRVDTGTRNRLQSVGYAGGDAGSSNSNVTLRYSYSGVNNLNVYHPQDPSALSG